MEGRALLLILVCLRISNVCLGQVPYFNDTGEGFAPAFPFRPPTPSPFENSENPNHTLGLFFPSGPWLKKVPSYINRPLTKKMCRLSRFRPLRACEILLRPKSRLSRIWRKRAKKVLCPAFYKWDGKQSLTDFPKRTKRSDNPCRLSAVESPIVKAEEWGKPGVWRQLVIEPSLHLYQKIFLEKCDTNQPNYPSMSCTMHPIVFKAAVWNSSPDPDVIYVTVNAYCAYLKS